MLEKLLNEILKDGGVSRVLEYSRQNDVILTICRNDRDTVALT